MLVSTTLLKRVQLFNGLNNAELTAVAEICHERQVVAGEIIIQQNTTGTELYVVAEGSVEVFIQGLENSRTLVVLGKGQFIGEMALIDQGYRSASVRATREGATLYMIDSHDFYALCQANCHIGYVAMRNLAIDISFKLRHRNLAEL